MVYGLRRRTIPTAHSTNPIMPNVAGSGAMPKPVGTGGAKFDEISELVKACPVLVREKSGIDCGRELPEPAGLFPKLSDKPRATM